MPSLQSVAQRHLARRPSIFSDSMHVGSWELLRRVHQGAYADVYFARPRGSNQPCADFVLRVVREEHADDPIAHRMMAAEAQVGGTVVHAHLITVLESHLRHAPPHLVLPRLEGVTLEVLCREGQCTVRRSLRAGRQIAEALAALHNAGWRHGDVKPANVVVSPEGHATLIDLSMASPLNQPSCGQGTRQFAAPELTAGDSPGRGSDIYALGATLFQLLTGRPAFTGATVAELAHAHANAQVPRLETWAPRVPPAAARIIRRMLQKSPHDRPQAYEVIEELVASEIESFTS